MKYGKINSALNGNIKQGVLYATYSALIGESSQNGGKYKTRLKQVILDAIKKLFVKLI
jgi:hypothetical protein